MRISDWSSDVCSSDLYTVFNCEQIEGLPAHYYARAEEPASPVARLEQADAFFAATRADIRHGGDRAYYALQPDYVRMPPAETFRDAESYAATLAHGPTHCPRPPSPPHRDPGRQRWGADGHAPADAGPGRGAPFLSAPPR